MTELFSFYYEAEMLDLLYSNWFFLQKEKSVYWYIMGPGNRKVFLKKKELDFIIRMHGYINLSKKHFYTYLHMQTNDTWMINIANFHDFFLPHFAYR